MIIEWDPIEKNQKCKLQSLNGVDTSNSIKNIEVRYMIDRKDYTCRKMDWHINKVADKGATIRVMGGNMKGKRKMASTLTFLGGSFATTSI